VSKILWEILPYTATGNVMEIFNYPEEGQASSIQKKFTLSFANP